MGPLTSAIEIWNHLKDAAGLDEKGYDRDIADAILSNLSPSHPGKDITAVLQDQSVTPERFIGAFLKAVQPYAEMMREMCVFFYRHGIRKTNRGLLIQFDFGRGPEDLGFDLSHFREVLWKYTRIRSTVLVRGWGSDPLWALNALFSNFQGRGLDDAAIREWIRRYSNDGEFAMPLPALISTSDPETDNWLNQVWHVWSTIVTESRNHGPTRAQLMENAKAEVANQGGARPLPADGDEQEARPERWLELPEFCDWTARTLAQLDSDGWARSMLQGLAGFAQQVAREEDDRVGRVDVLDRVRKLFDDVPSGLVEKEKLLAEFIELLNLPIWKHRYELYQTWVLSQIDLALDAYERTIHHIDGVLLLSFSGTHVGTLETVDGRVHLWSELRSPLAKRLSDSARKHVQPDYSLVREPVTSPLQTLCVVECKQYKVPSRQRFSEVITAYAAGRPNAKVILVNYGGVQSDVIDQLDARTRCRASAIGEFAPNNADAFDDFKQAIASSLPAPSAGKQATASLPFDTIAVDVSGSMDTPLGQLRTRTILDMLIALAPNARLLAIDTSVVKEWATASSSAKELLSLPRRGSTELRAALKDCDLEKCVVITDRDGWQQWVQTPERPFMVVEIGHEQQVSKSLAVPEFWPGKEMSVSVSLEFGSERTFYVHFRD